MIEKVDKLIIDWLKSGSENTTYLAGQICGLYDDVEQIEPPPCEHDYVRLAHTTFVECSKCGKVMKHWEVKHYRTDNNY